MDASLVIALRLGRMASFNAAAMTEAQLMVTEKLEAATQLQLIGMTGGLGLSPAAAAQKSIAHYQRAVSKNRRRLSKPCAR